MNRKKAANLFSILTFLFYSLFLIYVCNHYFNINSTNYVLFFLVLLIFINLFWLFVIFCIGPKVKAQIIIINSSCIIGLLLFEAFLNLYIDIKTDISSNNSSNDNRTVKEIVEDYNSMGNASVPVLSPNFFDSPSLLNIHLPIYPLSGQSNKLTIYCKESGRYEKYYSDRYGCVTK